MTRDAIGMLVARHKEGYARRDVDLLVDTHAPHATFESPAYGVVQGRDAIRDIFRYWYTAFPDMLLTWESALIDPPRASWFWTLDGTAAGQFFGEVKVGSKVHMIGASECECGEEGIVAIRHVFDFSGALVRTGVMKMKPSS
jgi:predicted ester cyclase